MVWRQGELSLRSERSPAKIGKYLDEVSSIGVSAGPNAFERTKMEDERV